MLLGRESLTKLKISLRVVQATGEETQDILPSFLYPNSIERKPPYRFLDLVAYHKSHAEQTKPPADKIRQDGLYLVWDTERILKELTTEQRATFDDQIKAYTPHIYAFVPYQGSIWGELNLACTGHKLRNHLSPGLMVAVNRQRLADISDIQASRYETFSRNVLVIVHYDGAKPDQGRKTVEVEALDLANKIADRVVQYLAKQRELLRPPGESPTPGQRAVEKNHSDWEFNVKIHAKTSPLHIPTVTFISTPLTEQDVVGLFHQLSVLGVFFGIRIYATSQTKTYDCLIEYQSDAKAPQLRYSEDKSPFGLSPFALGEHKQFATKALTLEFKNNLDGLIADLGEESTSKSFGNIDICVCWSMNGDKFSGYEVVPINEINLDERAYPGVTHLLRRDGDVHVISLIFLKTVIEAVRAGQQTISL